MRGHSVHLLNAITDNEHWSPAFPIPANPQTKQTWTVTPPADCCRPQPLSPFIIIIIIQCEFAFSALTLLAGCQEAHPAHKNLSDEVCLLYTSDAADE